MTDDTQITVSRSIDASAAQLFDVLSNPERHPEIDGSDMVRSDEKTDRVTAVGQVFRMNMHHPAMGDYQTDNHVTGFDPNHLLAWQTAAVDEEPAGWEWVWQLEADGPDRATARLTYDWSKVTDTAVLERVQPPVVSADQLEHSLDKLAEAVAG